MSEDNLELMAEAVALFNAKNWERLSELYHSDAVVRAPQGWPEPGPFVGLDAILHEFEHLHEAFDDATLELVGEMRPQGDRVIMRMRWRVVGHGPESSLEVTALCTVRQGRILYQEYFWEHEQALLAAGLSELRGVGSPGRPCRQRPVEYEPGACSRSRRAVGVAQK